MSQKFFCERDVLYNENSIDWTISKKPFFLDKIVYDEWLYERRILILVNSVLPTELIVIIQDYYNQLLLYGYFKMYTTINIKKHLVSKFFYSQAHCILIKYNEWSVRKRIKMVECDQRCHKEKKKYFNDYYKYKKFYDCFKITNYYELK